MTSLAKLILATLTYSDIFDYPLTFAEIHCWLVGTTDWENNNNPNTAQGKKISLAGLKNTLSLLVKNKQIELLGDYYFLFARQQTVQNRLSRLKPSQEKLTIAHQAGNILAKIGWISLVGITGSLAMNNCREDDDIDLLIITKKNRLWLVRPLATLLLLLSGSKVRRFGDKNVKNKLCLNMFMEEGDLLIKEQNLFTAHEITQMVPIYQKDETYSKFISDNRWVNRFLVNYSPPIKSNEVSSSNVNYINIFIYYLNQLFYLFQKSYMQAKQTKEVILLHRASFHPTLLNGKIKKLYLDNGKLIN